MRRSPLISFMIILALVLALPYVFSNLVAASLVKLHLSQDTALLILGGILIGGFIDIPILRFQRREEVPVDPMAVFGLSGFMHMERWQHETIIAVNVGGCLIPAGLALYELGMLHGADLHAAGVASLITTIVCFIIARPVPGVGILIPGILPAGVAAVSAMLLSPSEAPPVAFIASVVGVIVGADFFHLPRVTRSAIGVASIGGAGTFDAIVLSGIIAAYLA